MQCWNDVVTEVLNVWKSYMWTAEWRNNGASLCCAKNRSCDITLRESGFRNPANFYREIWNPGLWNPEYCSRNLNPTNNWNQEPKLHSQRIRNSVPGFRNPEFKTFLDSLKAWFSYAADAPATWPPVLPGILFRYENRSGRQHWSSQCLPHHVLIRPRSSPGGTGRYVADTSAAYENQALHRAKRREFCLFPIFANLMLTTKIHCVRFGMCEVRRLKWALPVFHKTAKHFRCIKYENIKR